MPSPARLAVMGLAGLFSAVAVASPLVVDYEGWLLRSYNDPVGIPTVCAGVTGGVQPGQAYSQARCEEMTAQALLKHAIAIRPCLPDDLHVDTRAAVVSFAYNVGAKKACSSTMFAKARTGDLRAACAELDRWVFAGGRKLPGLVRRRAAERALCERGLS